MHGFVSMDRSTLVRRDTIARVRPQDVVLRDGNTAKSASAAVLDAEYLGRPKTLAVWMFVLRPTAVPAAASPCKFAVEVPEAIDLPTDHAAVRNRGAD